MDWISVVVTVCGSLLIARHDIRGFAFWITANVTWIVWALSRNPPIYSVIALNLVYFAINVYGVRRWRRLASQARSE